MKRAMLLTILILVVGIAFAEEFELRTEQWQPPRLVDGVWVTSGISTEKAKEYAAEANAGQTEQQVRDGEWDAHWKLYWQEPNAPEWARERRRIEAREQQEAAERRAAAEQQRQIQQAQYNAAWWQWASSLSGSRSHPAQRRFWDKIGGEMGSLGHALLDAQDEMESEMEDVLWELDHLF